MIVEVSTHGSVIKRDHDSFVVKCGAESTEIPAEKVSAILVTANALVSTPAIKLAIVVYENYFASSSVSFSIHFKSLFLIAPVASLRLNASSGVSPPSMSSEPCSLSSL